MNYYQETRERISFEEPKTHTQNLTNECAKQMLVPDNERGINMQLEKQ